MRQPRRYQSLKHRDQPLSHELLNLRGFCRKHHCGYPLNVVNNGRIECGQCPKCSPPKKPAAPEGSSE